MRTIPTKPRDISDSLGKLPPQALDLEEAVIGAILLHKQALLDVVEFLRPEHFYSDAHAEIFNAVFGLWVAGEPIDLKSVVHHLQRAGQLEKVGGAYNVAQLQSRVSSSDNIVHHARIIIELALKRKMILLASRIHHEAYEDTTDVFELLQQVQDDFTGLSNTIPNRKAAFTQYIESHSFNPANVPREDDTLLFIRNIPIGSRENIITITGKSKSRKTIAASAIATSLFNEEFLVFASVLPKDARILHVDTEQGYKHYFHSVQRIFRDASIPYQERFTSIHTRDADIPMRLELIDHLVESIRPSVLIIDGLTDLVYDINDQAEATKIGEKFLQISSKYQLLVIGVIHTTKTTGFMTGAIGTIFEKKSETVIKVELDEEDKMVSHISCQFSRNAPFPEFSIRADKDGNYSLENEANIEKDGVKDFNFYSKERHIDFLTHIFGKNSSLSEHKLHILIKKHADSFLGNPLSPRNAQEWAAIYKIQMYLVSAPNGDLAIAFKPLQPLHDAQLKIRNSELDDIPF